LALLIGVLGFTQLVGGIAGCKPMKGLGAALSMAPYPKVFSDSDGLETFASEFTIHTRTGNGKWDGIVITPKIYSKVGGSYNRRNVYGAALAYGPRLPEGMRRAVLGYALERPGLLAREMGLPDGEKVVEIRTKTRGRQGSWALAARAETERQFLEETGRGQ